jgi:NADH-quinone oxidoreductase subunit L
LKKQMPITHITFLIGCLAIAGIPFLSGFFSKDEIMANAFAYNPVLYAITFLAAMMTAFYMFRLYFLTFTGTFRGTAEQKHHLHESPALMSIPLVVLAVLSVIGGYVGLPAVISEHHTLQMFLSPVVKNATHGHLSHTTEWLLMGLSVIGVLVMIAWARKATKAASFPEQVGLNKVLEQKWYVDELYNAIVFQPLMRLGQFINTFFDTKVIDGAVNGIGKLTKWGSDRMRFMQNGMVGTYLFIMVIGAIAICAISFFCIYQ